MDSSNSFKKYLIYSLVFHFFAFLFLWLMGKISPVEPIKTTEVTMIRLTRGTSLEGNLFKEPARGTPEATEIPKAVEVKPTQVATPVTPTTKPPPKTPTQPPKPSSQQVHLKKSKESTKTQPPKPKTPTVEDAKIAEALGQVQQELKSRETQQQTGAEGAGPGLPEGTGDSNVPVFGSPKGGVSAQDPAYVQYQATVRSKIIREWIQSGGGPQETALRCRVKVRVDAGGNVIAKTVIRKSGNESFDLSALRAIERASPLPTPPEQLKGEALQEGLVVDFSSKML